MTIQKKYEQNIVSATEAPKQKPWLPSNEAKKITSHSLGGLLWSLRTELMPFDVHKVCGVVAQ